MLRILLLALLFTGITGHATAKIVAQDVIYKLGDQEFEGYVAYDDAIAEKRPGVLVVHQWKGLGEYEKLRSRMLAELGYVAFAADIYGKGIRPDSKGAGSEAGKYKGDRKLFRERLNLAFEQLRKNEHVNPEKLAAIGYCFGGTGVLELARSGADVDAVVSFHGGLDSPTPADGANIKGTVLICHGAADPASPDADIAAFKQEMESNNVDWQMNTYAKAVHGFTEKGSRYNEKADLRSWRDMQEVFEEKLK